MFWSNVTKLQSLINPLYKTSLLFQSDTSTLSECFVQLKIIYETYVKMNESDLISKLEERWRKFEQPLFIIAMVMDPSIKLSLLNFTINWGIVRRYAIFYYEKWFNEKPTKLVEEITDYEFGIQPEFQLEYINSFSSPTKYWMSLQDMVRIFIIFTYK